MANSSIEIEIVANFKDNATDKVKTLNSELDKLENRSINIDATAPDSATKMADELDRKLSRIDGSKASQELDSVNAKAEQFANGVTEKNISVNTSSAERAIDSLQQKIDSIGETSINVTPAKESIWVNGEENIITYEDTIAHSAEEALEEIPRTMRRVNAGGANYGYDQSVIDHIEKYANSHAGLSNTAEIPDNFWTELATAEDKNLYRNGQMSALALAQFGAVNPDALSAADRAEYDKLTGISQIVDSISEETPRSERVSPNAAKYYGYDQSAIDHIENYGSEESLQSGMSEVLNETSNRNKQLLSNISQFGSRMARRFIGARMVYSGVENIVSDFAEALDADNRNDTNRSIARGLTKSGLMGAGAAIGTFLGPGGTLLGAGTGALLGEIFGDDLADSISGITKSAEELRQERLDEIFGDIAMSAEDLSKVAQNMVGTWSTQVSQAHQQALSTGYSLQDNTNSSYFGVVESGSKLDIKGNLGFYIPDDDFSSYKTQVNEYMDSIEETMTQEMYNAFMVNDDLFGYGQWDTAGLSDKWKTAFEAFYKQKKELSKYLERALSDDNFSFDEREHVFGIIHGVQQTTTELSPDEGQVKQNSYEFLSKNGLLSKDSYDDLIENMQSDYSNRIYELSTTRSQSIANGMSKDEADKVFWDEMNTSTESYLQSILDSTHNMYNADYSTALSSSWDGKTTFWGKNINGLNQIYEDGSLYQNTLSSAMSFDNLYHTDNNGYAAYYRDDSLSTIQKAQKILYDSFDNVNGKTQQALGAAYEGMLPMVEQIEGQAKNAVANGQDPSAYLDELMGMYQMGALGGGKVSKEKYTAMLMAGDKTSADAINAIFGNDYELMESTMGEDFADMWQLINGSGSSGAEAIQKQAEEEQKALDEAAEKTAQAAQDASEKKKDAIDEIDDKVEEATKDNTEKITNATDESNDQITEATENPESAENLAESIIQTINDSLANIDGSQLQDINLGETLMNSISESLSTDNMDFSQLTIGESVLKGISSSLEGADLSGLDIGSRIMESINTSMGECLEINPNFNIIPGNVDISAINAAVTSAIADIAGSNAGISVAATITGTVNYELGEYPSTIPMINGTADYELGDAPTEAPDISGIADYTGIFPSSAPTLYGTVIYQSSFTGGVPSISANGHAMGGFVSGRQLSWVGEEGPEAIIPLVPGRRGRGLDLWMQAGRALGVMENANGGIIGGEPSYGNSLISLEKDNKSKENNVINLGGNSSGGSANVTISPGAVTVSITVSGGNGNVVEEIKAHSTEIAEVVADELDRHLSAIFANSIGGGE